MPYGPVLALNAGVMEELLFRLGIPALLFGIVGDAPIAFLGAAILFGVLHMYQGPIGVASALVLGLVFSAVYVLSGSILLVIGLHALVDVRSLVLIPLAVAGAWRVAE